MDPSDHLIERMSRFAAVLLAVLAAMVIPSRVAGGTKDSRIFDGPVEISILATSNDRVVYYRLSAANYGSAFTLERIYVPFLAAKEGRVTEIERSRIDPGLGRELASSFWGLSISNSTADYWTTARWESPCDEIGLQCGIVECPQQDLFVLGCPMSERASGDQSPESNKVAWYLTLLEGKLKGASRTALDDRTMRTKLVARLGGLIDRLGEADGCNHRKELSKYRSEADWKIERDRPCVADHLRGTLQKAVEIVDRTKSNSDQLQ